MAPVRVHRRRSGCPIASTAGGTRWAPGSRHRWPTVCGGRRVRAATGRWGRVLILPPRLGTPAPSPRARYYRPQASPGMLWCPRACRSRRWCPTDGSIGCLSRRSRQNRSWGRGNTGQCRRCHSIEKVGCCNTGPGRRCRSRFESSYRNTGQRVLGRSRPRPSGQRSNTGQSRWCRSRSGRRGNTRDGSCRRSRSSRRGSRSHGREWCRERRHRHRRRYCSCSCSSCCCSGCSGCCAASGCAGGCAAAPDRWAVRPPPRPH